MVNGKKLVWSRLADTCDDYMCDIVRKEIGKKYILVRTGKLSPTKAMDASAIALKCIEVFLRHFTIDEIKKAVKKLREIGYHLPTIELMRVSEGLVDTTYKVGKTSKMSYSQKMQTYMQGIYPVHEYAPIKDFSGISHKNTKGFSNKYYESYRKKSK